jgi:hypothetical protein
MQPDQRIMQRTEEPPLQLGFGLCQAFYDEPNFTFIFPDIRVRQVALPWFLGALSSSSACTMGRSLARTRWMEPPSGSVPTRQFSPRVRCVLAC